MGNKLKYHQFIQNFLVCPPPICKEINSNVFRFIFEDKNHENNFKPVLLIKPCRINDKSFDTDELKCSGYALSFFDSLSNARNLFMRQLKRNKNIGNNIGNHIAEVLIESLDGIATEPSSNESDLGHFDFFEYVKTNFYNKIINIERTIQ